MAVDKLVDSTQLNADLTSVANAIRVKGGTSGQLAFPAGFVSAVQAIPTGITPTGTKQISITENGTTTEDVTNYANAEITVNVSGSSDPDLAVFDYTNFSNNRINTGPTNRYFAQNCTQKKVKVILNDSYSGISPCFFGAAEQLEEVEIQTNGTITDLSTGPIVYQSHVKHLTLNFSTKDVHASGWGAYTFRDAGDGTGNSCRIDGQPIDLSGVESDTTTLCSSGMFYQAKINYVRFKPNTLNMSGTAHLSHGITSGSDVADEDSMISTINALGETTTGTIGWIGTSNARRTQIESLMGRVDDSNGYHLFVKDPSGSLSLADFVTNVKGWTLA